DFQMTEPVQARTLGLVTGLGMGAGIHYYRSLVNAHVARGAAPRIVMVHADVRQVMDLAAGGEVRQLALYLNGLLGQLSGAGAEVATIPAFTPQICAEELSAITPLPLISLLDAIVAEVDRRQLQRVCIFGARVTMQTKLFGRLENRTEVVPLRPDEFDLVNAAYAKIVGAEHASPGDYELLRGLAHALVLRERLDSVVLAGTDFSLVFPHGNTDFPNLDGARVHLDAVMRELLPG